jgi:hypothetical protein
MAKIRPYLPPYLKKPKAPAATAVAAAAAKPTGALVEPSGVSMAGYVLAAAAGALAVILFQKSRL